MKNTFPKTESLKSKKLIRLLFETGSSEFIYPFKILYHFLETDEKHRAQVLISVGKKKIKTAVERNRIKRLFRESYRINKHPLLEMLEKKEKHLILGFIYVGDSKMEYSTMEHKMKAIIKLLTKQVK